MRKNQILYFTTISLMLYLNPSIEAFNTFKEVSWKQKSVNLVPSKTFSILHDEVVATFLFEQYSKELLLLTATIEKNHFISALKRKGDCPPQDMMQVCGNKYLIENFDVKINDQEVLLKKESLSIKKDVVVLTYMISIPKQPIQQINVNSDYMFEFNNHSILKVIFDLSHKTRTFNLKNKRRTITAKFK